jgi:RNA polymerase sigma-70 factor (ECF subfamily)
MAPALSSVAPTADAGRSLHFERQVLPHLDAAWGLARWLARSQHDAEDLLQEAMLRAYRYYDGGARDNVRGWLLAIVRNTFYTLRTQAASAPSLDEFDEAIHGGDADPATPELVLLRDVDAVQLQQAIGRLAPEFREVLVLREFEDCSYKQIAEITGVKMGTVMSRLARARERLAQLLCATAGDGRQEGGRQDAVQ